MRNFVFFKEDAGETHIPDTSGYGVVVCHGYEKSRHPLAGFFMRDHSLPETDGSS